MHFTVFTDCNSVRATALKKDLNPLVARWWIKLQDYDFTIEYRPGSKMSHVDYLSRHSGDNECVLRMCDLRTINVDRISDTKTLSSSSKTVTRSVVNYLITQIAVQTLLGIINNVVVTKTKPPKCFVPIAARLLTMKLYHDESSHIGWDKCEKTYFGQKWNNV